MESIKFVSKIWLLAGFKPSTTTPNTNVVYYGDNIFHGKIKIV